MSVATRQRNPWRIAVMSGVVGLSLTLLVFACVGAVWMINWTYGEETMIGIGANAMLILPRVVLMAVGSVFGVAVAIRSADVRSRDVFLISIVITAVMCVAIVNWQRFLSNWYSERFVGISLIELLVALIAGAIAGLLGSLTIRLTSARTT